MGNTKRKPRGKPFTKGDTRINRKGRPQNFDMLRDLAQKIADEKVESRRPLAEEILRNWSVSHDFQKEKAFLEIAYGKVPDKTEISGGTVLQIEYVNDWRKGNPSEPASRTT